ncbi:hypothetical protein [Paenibacillus cremeus]|uniref:DUF4352 domain-containing protein n=1 Tax=Paenibacillus cremeus TaxID=2163881 RepID=A0A559KBM8_9BACL|nr:hypothetical protein [Paenibacillus cremeus]TVY09542.1 hypothetical protein FPZ49_12430 [Paenibacillus cremeus]
MNNKLTKTAASIVISAALLSTGGYTALAADEPTAAAQTAAIYKLTDLLDVEVKTVLNERIVDGTRLGVVIRMKNNGSTLTRVPEYELRVKTNEGIEYTLQPSASNPKAIQPKANTELSYMAVIDRTDDVTLTDVSWTDVDYYVYPKKETLIVSAPITVQPWKGSDTAITDPSAVKKWSETFSIPSLTSPILYTPIAINKETSAQGTVYVLQLLAYNPTEKRETVPDFLIDGKSNNKVYSGKKVEQSTLALDAKEEQYIHFAFTTDQDDVLTSLNVLTPEKFAQAGTTLTAVGAYNVGRLNILLPTKTDPSTYEAYTLGTPMKFDSRSELINPDMQVSVVEFTMSKNKEEGSQTVTAKFKLTNKSDRPIAVPAFQTDLVSSDGYEYSGSRQNVTSQYVLPNSAIPVSYSYTVPDSETGKGFGIKIQDTKMAAPYKTTIASYAVELQQGQADDAATANQFSVYPFNVKVTAATTSFSYLPATLNYTYRTKMTMELSRLEQVQVDPNFSHLQFDLYDNSDRLIGSATGSFIGTSRLVTGDNVLKFNSGTESFEPHTYIKVYEVFTSANGESKRLLSVLK